MTRKTYQLKNQIIASDRDTATLSTRLDFQSDAVTITAAASEGELPVIEMLAYTGAAIRQRWSDESLVINLQGIRLPDNPSDVPILLEHSVSQGVGHATSLKTDDKGLHLLGLASRATPYRDEVVNSSRNGYPWKSSIGASELVVQYFGKEETLEANGREFPGPVIYVVECKLDEVSFVSLAADGATNAVAAAKEKEEVMKVVKELIKLQGQKIAASEPQGGGEKKPAEGDVTAQKPEGTPPAEPGVNVDPSITARREAEALEVKRIADIAKVCAGSYADIEAKAILEGWTAEKTELEVLRASRPQSVNVVVGSNEAMTASVLEAAVCQTLNLSNIEKSYDDKTLEAADKAFRGAIGLNQLLHIAAQQGGYDGSPFFRTDGPLRSAIRAAFSTQTLSSVLSNVANKFILEGFYSEERTWEQIAKINPNVPNFKEYETYNRVSQLRLRKLAPDGRIKHGTVGDERYGNKLDTYAVILTLPRQAFIDDDIGILSSIASEFGVGSAETLNDLFWGEFLDDATFFSSGNGNLTTGAGGALGESSLEAGFTKFRGYKQKFAGEVTPIGLEPKYLLTGPSLAFAAARWMRGGTLITGDSVTRTDANVLSGLAEPLVSRYITSATNWYLLADPVRRPTMEVGFLRGKTKPTVEEVEPDADVLGVSMRAYWDFGCRKQVPLGGLKVNGA